MNNQLDITFNHINIQFGDLYVYVNDREVYKKQIAKNTKVDKFRYNFANDENENIFKFYLTNGISNISMFDINGINLLDVLYHEAYVYDKPQINFTGNLTSDHSIIFEIRTPIHLSMLYWVNECII